jgi:ADP-ribose pyrophosphatase YjhB (NUDIX family)
VSTHSKNAHCSYCGTVYAAGQPWPRTCVRCANITYLNPLPVAVVVLPVDGGVLCVRRAIEPRLGHLALPGGFIDVDETWQDAAVRELREETGVVIDAGEVSLLAAHSAPERGVLLLFGLVRSRTRAELGALEPTEEVSECIVLRQPEELAFPLHTRVLREFFARGYPA